MTDTNDTPVTCKFCGGVRFFMRAIPERKPFLWMKRREACLETICIECGAEKRHALGTIRRKVEAPDEHDK